MRYPRPILTAVCTTAIALASAGSADGDSKITFQDIARDPASGLTYERTPSPTKEAFDLMKATLPFFTIPDLLQTPIKPHGAPGVALADFDGDGDLDLYVTNGPGTPNSLFISQLQETGSLTFVDRGATSGAGAVDQDSTGVCFGDVDNDGDHDLYVLGNAEPNRLFEDLGDGAFQDITSFAAVGGGLLTTTSCSFGDVDGDGLLDLVVANANDGTGHFTDVSPEVGTVAPGGWMGFAFGDLNCDRQLDFFATNFGDFAALRQTGGQAPLGILASRWYLGSGGAFIAPPLTDLGTTPFGWGASILDYDNDGDDDILYHGGMDLTLNIEASNGGVLLTNQGCTATFTRATAPFHGSTDHSRRTVNGVAVGDLDGNGYEDVVSVSNFDFPKSVPVQPVPGNTTVFTDAGFVITFLPGAAPG